MRHRRADPRRPHPRGEGVAHRGRRHVDRPGAARPRHPGDHRDGRAERRPRLGAARGRPDDRALRPVRLRPRRQLGPRAGRGGRAGPRRGDPHQGRPRAARADDQPAPAPARRPRLRVLLRGPAAVRQDRRRLRPRRAEPRSRRDREAPGRQRGGVRAHHHQLGRRRAVAARALPGAVRDRHPRGGADGGHDVVQPGERVCGAARTGRCCRTCCAATSASTAWS